MSENHSANAARRRAEDGAVKGGGPDLLALLVGDVSPTFIFRREYGRQGGNAGTKGGAHRRSGSHGNRGKRQGYKAKERRHRQLAVLLQHFGAVPQDLHPVQLGEGVPALLPDFRRLAVIGLVICQVPRRRILLAAGNLLAAASALKFHGGKGNRPVSRLEGVPLRGSLFILLAQGYRLLQLVRFLGEGVQAPQLTIGIYPAGGQVVLAQPHHLVEGVPLGRLVLRAVGVQVQHIEGNHPPAADREALNQPLVPGLRLPLVRRFVGIEGPVQGLLRLVFGQVAKNKAPGVGHPLKLLRGETLRVSQRDIIGQFLPILGRVHRLPEAGQTRQFLDAGVLGEHRVKVAHVVHQLLPLLGRVP